MIREAFRQNGIEFAQPSVQVGGDDKGGGAAAAALRAKATADVAADSSALEAYVTVKYSPCPWIWPKVTSDLDRGNRHGTGRCPETRS